jgi:DNA-binding NarL/FixJ family response regulator
MATSHEHECDRAGSAPDHAELHRATVEARAALQEAVVAAALAADRAMTIVAALDDALAALNASAAAAPPSANEECEPVADVQTREAVESLSPREREVLTLVAEGRSNKAIAEALYVSPNTVKTHVASLLSKLHAHTRVQLAAIATRQSLRSGVGQTRRSPEWGMSAA